MKVHFIGAKQRIKERIKDYRTIVKAIHSHGDQVTDDWLESAYELAMRAGRQEELDWNGIYHDNMEALARADVVIADITDTNFAIGYMTAVGLQHKKPTLLLYKDGAISGTMASGMDETLVSMEEYDDNSAELIVKQFLDENHVETKDMRFNFFIDRPIYNYLRWASYKTGKTKAEILRELVTREIDKANDGDSF